MRFLIDECISPATAELLRQLGHDVLDIKGINRFGITDQEVYRIACEQNRTVFTTDKGFGNSIRSVAEVSLSPPFGRIPRCATNPA